MKKPKERPEINEICFKPSIHEIEFDIYGRAYSRVKTKEEIAAQLEAFYNGEASDSLRRLAETPPKMGISLNLPNADYFFDGVVMDEDIMNEILEMYNSGIAGEQLIAVLKIAVHAPETEDKVVNWLYNVDGVLLREIDNALSLSIDLLADRLDGVYYCIEQGALDDAVLAYSNIQNRILDIKLALQVLNQMGYGIDIEQSLELYERWFHRFEDRIYQDFGIGDIEEFCRENPED